MTGDTEPGEITPPLANDIESLELATPTTSGAYATGASVKQDRPCGITLLGLFFLVSGLIGLCLWPLRLLGSTAGAFLGILGVGGGIGGIVSSLFSIVGAVLQLIVAYGIFNLRPWAWWLGIIATGISIIGGVLGLFGGISLIGTVFSIAIPLIIFIYLWTPNVRRSFGLT